MIIIRFQPVQRCRLTQAVFIAFSHILRSRALHHIASHRCLNLELKLVLSISCTAQSFLDLIKRFVARTIHGEADMDFTVASWVMLCIQLVQTEILSTSKCQCKTNLHRTQIFCIRHGCFSYIIRCSNKVSPDAFSHLCNKQRAKCQVHSSPKKPSQTLWFHEGENNCLFKCFFIGSTSNLATHEVCHGGGPRREDHSFRLQITLHSEKPPSSSVFHTFFCSAFCHCFEQSISKLTFK